jgi:D-alanine-D-alanine ligase
MSDSPKVAVLSGGFGAERDVSLASGHALADALEQDFLVDLIDLREAALPSELDPSNTVVFPVVHGTFGEDGTLQMLLEEKGFSYAGSDRSSSRLCMDKGRTKAKVEEVGVKGAPDLFFQDPKAVDIAKVVSGLGNDLVIKPIDQGSSVALFVINGEKDLEDALSRIEEGNWMVEKRIFGREVTVGVLQGDSMGIVEVIPDGGVYDFKRKYSAGATEYRYPAVLQLEIENELKRKAELVFEHCGCRDFARVDFIICEDGHSHFLEINTLPGLTSTSLLPKSASCSGYDFQSLAKRLVEPAVDRFTRPVGNLLET